MISMPVDKERAFQRFASWDGVALVLNKEPLLAEVASLPMLALTEAYSNYTGKHNSVGDRFDFYLGCIDNDIPSASCGKENGVYCCGINRGLICAARNISFLMFSHPSIMRWVGNPSLETDAKHKEMWDRREIWGFGVPEYSLVNRAGTAPMEVNVKMDKDPALVPRCELRRRAALYFARQMVLIATMHELVHALRGHIEYHIRHLGDNRLVELVSQSNHVEYEKKMQFYALEHEADNRAISILLINLASGADLLLSYDVEFLTLHDRICIFILAGFLLCWLWWICDIFRRYSGVRLDGSLGQNPIISDRAFSYTYTPMHVAAEVEALNARITLAHREALGQLGILARIQPLFEIAMAAFPPKVGGEGDYLSTIERWYGKIASQLEKYAFLRCSEDPGIVAV
jgi:hypothetical protein